MSAGSTVAQGTFTFCGQDEGISLRYTCSGPSCTSLDGFPGTNCTATGNELSCTNGITCTGATGGTTTFTFNQDNIIVSQSNTVSFGSCGSLTVTSDGTTGGTNAQIENSADTSCQPSSSSNTSSTSSSSSSSFYSTSSSTSQFSHSLPYPPYPSSSHLVYLPSSSVLYSNKTASPGGLSIYPASVSKHYGPELPPSTSRLWPYHTVLNLFNGNSTTLCRCSTQTAAYVQCTPVPTTAAQLYYFPEETACPFRTYSPFASPMSGPYSYQSSGSSPTALSSTHLDAQQTHSFSGASGQGPSKSPPLIFSSGGTRSFRFSIFWVLVIIFSFLFQGSFAAQADIRLPASHTINVHSSLPAIWDPNVTSAELKHRQLSSGWKKFADLLSEYLAGKLTAVTGGESPFAENLVAEVEKAICDHLAGEITGKELTVLLDVDLMEACVTAVYTGNALAAPELEFLSVFGASLLCNYIISEAFPPLTKLTDAISEEICNQAKPCGDLLTDPNNCGSCGNVCPTGLCKNGACTSNTCTGQNCSSFGPCGPGGSCVCASTTEGTGFCVDGETACAGLATCGTSLDCASGEICAAETCCSGNVCVGATFCGGGSNNS